MRQWKQTKFRRWAALLAAGALCAAMTVPAFGAEGNAYTGVAGGKIHMEKYLIMDDQANVPNVTFRFSISGGQAQYSNGSSDESQATTQIYSGSDTTKVTGQPSVGTAVFVQGQETFEEAAAMPSGLGIKTDDDGDGAANADPVQLAADGSQKYARSGAEIDFSGVTFREPGIYRYIITELPVDATSANANSVENDADPDRVLDVYVTDDGSGTLQIEGYVLHNMDAAGTVLDSGANVNDSAVKADGFVNEYMTRDLKISKDVEGNQASRDEYFEVTVEIADATPGTVYQVDLSGADAVTKTNGINTDEEHGGGYTNPSAVTTSQSGTAQVTFWLQAGQYVVLQGLAIDTTWTASQDKTTMQNEGYTVEGSTNDVAADDGTGAGVVTDSEFRMTGRADRSDEKVIADAFVDIRDGVIPTGVMVAILPGAAALLAGAGGFAFLKLRRRSEK